MACLGYCFLGFIFIGIMAAFALTSKNTPEMKSFKDSLEGSTATDDRPLSEHYEEIIRGAGLSFD